MKISKHSSKKQLVRAIQNRKNSKTVNFVDNRSNLGMQFTLMNSIHCATNDREIFNKSTEVISNHINNKTIQRQTGIGIELETNSIKYKPRVFNKAFKKETDWKGKVLKTFTSNVKDKTVEWSLTIDTTGYGESAPDDTFDYREFNAEIVVDGTTLLLTRTNNDIMKDLGNDIHTQLTDTNNQTLLKEPLNDINGTTLSTNSLFTDNTSLGIQITSPLPLNKWWKILKKTGSPMMYNAKGSVDAEITSLEQNKKLKLREEALAVLYTIQKTFADYGASKGDYKQNLDIMPRTDMITIMNMLTYEERNTIMEYLEQMKGEMHSSKGSEPQFCHFLKWLYYYKDIFSTYTATPLGISRLGSKTEDDLGEQPQKCPIVEFRSIGSCKLNELDKKLGLIEEQIRDILNHSSSRYDRDFESYDDEEDDFL